MDILTKPLSAYDPEIGIGSNNMVATYPEMDRTNYATYGKNAPPNYEKLSETKVPSSNTLFKSIQHARDTTTQTCKIWKRCGTFLFCSVTIIVILGILMAIPVTMIVVGTFKLNSCKIEKMIPIWLIVAGGLSIVKNVSTLIQRIQAINNSNKNDKSSSSNTTVNIFDSLMAVFLLGWFIVGNVWVYGNRSSIDFRDKQSANYCDEFTYFFAFWIITSCYILLLSSCFLFCCTVCFTIFLTPKK